jgi:hypothetical protein
VFAALVNAIAVGAAGELGVVSLGIPLVLCGVAIALRPADEPVQHEPVEPPREAPAPAAPADSLWTDPVENGSTPRQGLWSR